jgi:hypothetical protein
MGRNRRSIDAEAAVVIPFSRTNIDSDDTAYFSSFLFILVEQQTRNQALRLAFDNGCVKR